MGSLTSKVLSHTRQFSGIRDLVAGSYSVYVDTNIITALAITDLRVTNSNPNWQIQVQKRQEAGTAYRRKVTSIESVSRLSGICAGKTPSYVRYRNDGYYVGLPTDFPSSFPSTDESLRNLALTRLKRKLQEKVGSAELLAPTAELRELRGLCKQVIGFSGQLVKAIIDARKKGDPVSLFKFASDTWLGYNMALSPLVSDIRKVAASISEFLSRADTNFTVSAAAKRTWLTSSKSSGNAGLLGASLYFSSWYEHELSYRYYAGGRFNLENDADYDMLTHLGLSWEALPQTAWELTMFSWVADYIANIGDVLGDVFWSLPGTTHFSGYTRRYKCKVVSKAYYIADNSNWYIYQQNVGGSIVNHFDFERVPLAGSLPHIGFRFRNYDEVVSNAATKLLNLIAVTTQRL